MVDAGADDAEGDAPDGDARDELPLAAERGPALAGQPDGGQDRDEQRQPVEVERQRAEVERAAGRAGDGAEHGADTATTARTGTGERVRTWLG